MCERRLVWSRALSRASFAIPRRHFTAYKGIAIAFYVNLNAQIIPFQVKCLFTLLFSSSFSRHIFFPTRPWSKQQIILIHICLRTGFSSFPTDADAIILLAKRSCWRFSSCGKSHCLFTRVNHYSSSAFLSPRSRHFVSCSTSKCCEKIIKIAGIAIISSKSRLLSALMQRCQSIFLILEMRACSENADKLMRLIGCPWKNPLDTHFYSA